MHVESLYGDERILKVRCSGKIGHGSESVSSMRPLASAIDAWLNSYADDAVDEIVLDFTDVEYGCGDAPVVCLLPFIKRGVERFRFLASAHSASALESVLATLKLPWFSVERVD
jgi:hypothetical protein